MKLPLQIKQSAAGPYIADAEGDPVAETWKDEYVYELVRIVNAWHRLRAEAPKA